MLDLGSPEAETPEVVAERIRRALEVVPPERLIVAPDCGMKYLPRDLAFGKLQAMVAGARIVARASSEREGGEPESPRGGSAGAYPGSVEVRGRGLAGELMGRVTSASTSTCCSPRAGGGAALLPRSLSSRSPSTG